MNFTVVEWIGYSSALLGIATFVMATMIRLRLTGIAHNLLSITFGLLAGVYPTVVQHLILLPLNSYRLYEMMKLIKNVKAAAADDHSMDWLKPFTTRHFYKAGATIFKKGDDADRMFFVATGRLRLPDIGVDVLPGAVIGELGLLSPGGKRTQTVVCAENADLLEISYTSLEELYYQNPTFGFYFLRLASERLFDNIARLERELAASKAEIARLSGNREAAAG
ncbi:MAG TPA: cyclic nucleotide-binding domain-containing protein [Xanthobacteraceae bacterium]|nr:cyclic nucleotide-binding domain-containing protein [Xanthobacteraceae bacterium]